MEYLGKQIQIHLILKLVRHTHRLGLPTTVGAPTVKQDLFILVVEVLTLAITNIAPTQVAQAMALVALTL
jgi:hypothetical protein